MLLKCLILLLAIVTWFLMLSCGTSHTNKKSCILQMATGPSWVWVITKILVQMANWFHIWQFSTVVNRAPRNKHNNVLVGVLIRTLRTLFCRKITRSLFPSSDLIRSLKKVVVYLFISSSSWYLINIVYTFNDIRN